jgi:hypothetical protein
MKKTVRQFHKGQSLVEFIIIGALVSIAAFVFLSPLSSNVKSQFYKFSPQKNTNVTAAVNATTTTLSVEEAKAVLASIKSNKSEQISDENLLKVANSLAKNSKENTSETSGSIANLVDQSSLSPEDEEMINKLKNETVSICVKALTPLAVSSNDVVAQIKEDIAAGKITENDLDLAGVDIATLEITENTEKPVNNLVNILNVSDFLVSQKKASPELIAKFDELKLQTKKALK